MKRFRRVYDVEQEQEQEEEEVEQQVEQGLSRAQAEVDKLEKEINQLDEMQRELEREKELKRAKLRRVQKAQEEQQQVKEAKRVADLKADEIPWITKIKKKPTSYIAPPSEHGKKSDSGYPGITLHYYTTKDGETHRRWRVRLNVKGKSKYIGSYKDLDDAVEALHAASKQLLGKRPLRYGDDDDVMYPYMDEAELEDSWKEMFG